MALERRLLSTRAYLAVCPAAISLVLGLTQQIEPRLLFVTQQAIKLGERRAHGLERGCHGGQPLLDGAQPIWQALRRCLRTGGFELLARPRRCCLQRL